MSELAGKPVRRRELASEPVRRRELAGEPVRRRELAGEPVRRHELAARPDTGPFAALLATPGVEEVLEVRSTFGFLAFHGGNLERMTDVVAVEAAARAGASVYAVVQPPDLRWHLPSTQVRPEASPALALFLDHVSVTVALHGYGRAERWTSLLLGGGNRRLAEHVGACLAEALPDHAVVTDLDHIPPALRGMHPENPVNRPAGGGTQLELPPRVRGTTPHWADWDGPGLPPPTEALVDGLARAAATWPSGERRARVVQGERRSMTQASPSRR
ncbi:hypothetical protein BH18ACT1_BH18ACT1_08470 [soil metagenome]